MKNKKLRPYMVYSAKEGAENGAELVFAHTAREARKVFWQNMSYTLTDEYIDVKAKWMWYAEFLYKSADKDKLEAGIVHHVINPPVCKECGMWGLELDENEICTECKE